MENNYQKYAKLHLLNIIFLSISYVFSFIMFIILFSKAASQAANMSSSTINFNSLLNINISWLVIAGILYIICFVLQIIGAVYAYKVNSTVGMILYIVGFFVFVCGLIGAIFSLIDAKKKIKINNDVSISPNTGL